MSWFKKPSSGVSGETHTGDTALPRDPESLVKIIEELRCTIQAKDTVVADLIKDGMQSLRMIATLRGDGPGDGKAGKDDAASGPLQVSRIYGSAGSCLVMSPTCLQHPREFKGQLVVSKPGLDVLYLWCEVSPPSSDVRAFAKRMAHAEQNRSRLSIVMKGREPRAFMRLFELASDAAAPERELAPSEQRLVAERRLIEAERAGLERTVSKLKLEIQRLADKQKEREVAEEKAAEERKASDWKLNNQIFNLKLELERANTEKQNLEGDVAAIGQENQMLHTKLSALTTALGSEPSSSAESSAGDKSLRKRAKVQASKIRRLERESKSLRAELAKARAEAERKTAELLRIQHASEAESAEAARAVIARVSEADRVVEQSRERKSAMIGMEKELIELRKLHAGDKERLFVARAAEIQEIKAAAAAEKALLLSELETLRRKAANAKTPAPLVLSGSPFREGQRTMSNADALSVPTSFSETDSVLAASPRNVRVQELAERLRALEKERDKIASEKLRIRHMLGEEKLLGETQRASIAELTEQLSQLEKTHKDTNLKLLVSNERAANLAKELSEMKATSNDIALAERRKIKTRAEEVLRRHAAEFKAKLVEHARGLDRLEKKHNEKLVAEAQARREVEEALADAKVRLEKLRLELRSGAADKPLGPAKESKSQIEDAKEQTVGVEPSSAATTSDQVWATVTRTVEAAVAKAVTKECEELSSRCDRRMARFRLRFAAMGDRIRDSLSRSYARTCRATWGACVVVDTPASKQILRGCTAVYLSAFEIERKSIRGLSDPFFIVSMVDGSGAPLGRAAQIPASSSRSVGAAVSPEWQGESSAFIFIELKHTKEKRDGFRKASTRGFAFCVLDSSLLCKQQETRRLKLYSKPTEFTRDPDKLNGRSTVGSLSFTITAANGPAGAGQGV